jgi:ferric-chelate reductase
LLTDETPNHRWVQCGPLAVSALTLLCILSVRPARERAYELFLFMHMIFALYVPPSFSSAYGTND